MKLGAPDHPKMERLAEILGIRHREAVGIIELLIHFTGRYAERGDIGRYPDSVIAKRLDWSAEDGGPIVLIAALESSGWIDTHGLHRFVVHDWPDHANDYTKRKLKDGLGWAVNDKPPSQKENSTIPENSGDSPENSGLLANPSLASPSQSLSEPDQNGAPAPHTDNRLINLLGKEPGTPEEKEAFLDHELPLLRVIAEREYPDDPKRQRHELRSRVIRHYRQHLKSRGEASTSEDGKAMGESTRRAIAQAEREKAERDRLAAEAQR